MSMLLSFFTRHVNPSDTCNYVAREKLFNKFYFFIAQNFLHKFIFIRTLFMSLSTT